MTDFLYTGTQPTRSHKTDAGLDLYSAHAFEIKPGESVLVGTGTRLDIPNGRVGQIWPRSGLSVNKSIETGAGVVDSGYRGEIKVKLYNHGKDVFKCAKGVRIAQILIMAVFLDNPLYVDVLPDAARGEKGFGSTGM